MKNIENVPVFPSLNSLHINYLLSTPTKIFHSFQMTKILSALKSRLQFPPTLINPENHFKFCQRKKADQSFFDHHTKEVNKWFDNEDCDRSLGHSHPTYYALVATHDPYDANLDVSNEVSIWWTVFPLTGPGRGWGLETIIRVYDPLLPPAAARARDPGPDCRLRARPARPLLNNFSVFLVYSSPTCGPSLRVAGRTLVASVLLKNLSPLSKLSSARRFVTSFYLSWIWEVRAPGEYVLEICLWKIVQMSWARECQQW